MPSLVPNFFSTLDPLLPALGWRESDSEEMEEIKSCRPKKNVFSFDILTFERPARREISAHHGVCREPRAGPQVRQGARAPPQDGALAPGVTQIQLILIIGIFLAYDNL